MKTISEILALGPVVPVLTIDDLETAVPLARALAAGGLPAPRAGAEEASIRPGEGRSGRDSGSELLALLILRASGNRLGI